MIKANELRIGNKFMHDGKIMTVDGMVDVELFGMQILSGINEIEIQDATPILLSPEILEACGYIDTGEEVWVNAKSTGEMDSVLGSTMNVFVYENEIEFNICSDAYNGYQVKINHLHQLQNLYFALTGEELEVKIPLPVS